MTKNANLLEAFLGEFCTIYLKEITMQMPGEEGPLEVPLILEGVIAEFDDRWILITDDERINHSLVALDSVAKIDVINDDVQGMTDPNKPKKYSDMN